MRIASPTASAAEAERLVNLADLVPRGFDVPRFPTASAA